MLNWDNEIIITTLAPEGKLPDGLRKYIAKDEDLATAQLEGDDTECSVIWRSHGLPGMLTVSELAEKFPECVIQLTYMDESMNRQYGEVTWENGGVVKQDIVEDLTFEKYLELGLSEDAWFETNAGEEDDWEALVADPDASGRMLAGLYDYLENEQGMEENDEIMEAITNHPNFDGFILVDTTGYDDEEDEF